MEKRETATTTAARRVDWDELPTLIIWENAGGVSAVTRDSPSRSWNGRLDPCAFSFNFAENK